MLSSINAIMCLHIGEPCEMIAWLPTRSSEGNFVAIKGRGIEVDNVARSIMGAHGEGKKQHDNFMAHRLQSTSVAFHAPIKMNKIHLPGNRHNNRNRSKHEDSTKQDTHLLGKGIATACLKSRMPIVHRPYPNMASLEVAKSRTCYPAWK